MKRKRGGYGYSIGDQDVTRRARPTDAQLRERAARALDLSLPYDGRGPKTWQARRNVAVALDLGLRPKIEEVRWLETVVATKGERGKARPR